MKKQKDDTLTEIFIAEKRALLSELPSPGHNEQQEIDLVYSQIRFAIREKISRESITSFDVIWVRKQKKNKYAKRMLQQAAQNQSYDVIFVGYQDTIDVCRKRIKAEQQKPKDIAVEAKPNVTIKFYAIFVTFQSKIL